MTKAATIAEAHEAIEGSRNVVNVVVLPRNARDFVNQKSNTAILPFDFSTFAKIKPSLTRLQ